MVGFQRPPEERVAREELVTQRLAVSRPGPQLFAASAATHGATEQSTEDGGERRVEPDDGVGPGPHHLASTAPRVVAVDDPAVAFDGARDALFEKIYGDELPVRTPRERV